MASRAARLRRGVVGELLGVDVGSALDLVGAVLKYVSAATVVPNVEALDRSIVMWRQFSHWLGGMGIIVLAVAVLPRLRVGGRQLLQSELAGPTEVERLTATIRDTARRLWILYGGLTAAAIAALVILDWTGAD